MLSNNKVKKITYLPITEKQNSETFPLDLRSRRDKMSSILTTNLSDGKLFILYSTDEKPEEK